MTPYPGPGRAVRVSVQSGSQNLWAPDGQELFYWAGDKLMTVSVETEPSLKLGMPELLFERTYYGRHEWFPEYDIHPDGNQFVMLKIVGEETGPRQINIILNWFEVLKEKMAGAGE